MAEPALPAVSEEDAGELHGRESPRSRCRGSPARAHLRRSRRRMFSVATESPPITDLSAMVTPLVKAQWTPSQQLDPIRVGSRRETPGLRGSGRVIVSVDRRRRRRSRSEHDVITKFHSLERVE